MAAGAVKWKPLLCGKETQKHKETDRQLIVLGERTWDSKAEQIVCQEGEGGGEGDKGDKGERGEWEPEQGSTFYVSSKENI